jgi:hypothetical protein
MSQNPSPQALKQQLSIGNVVTVSLNLYRSHLKLYFKLALSAHLWFLVPIYGWAKFFTIAALISRLGFDDLSGQSESINSVRSQLNRRMWHFLLTGILVVILSLLGMLILLILFSIIGGLLYALLSSVLGISQVGGADQLFKNWLYTGIVLPIAIVIYLSPVWFYSRFFITDLPLSVEREMSFLKAIKRSRELTKSFRRRLLVIILLAFLITLPILIIIWYGFGRLLALISYNLLRFYIQNSNVRLTLLLIILSLVIGVIIMPFWQSIKAAVYYDIRCRRESWDLKLPDRKASPEENRNV